jgi:DNA helicase-2/ATP-dependent DNA helicase PcrA
LRKLCLENCSDDEVELRGEIEAAIEDLKARVETDLTVRQAVDSCRRLDVSQGPVRSGVHLLNAHVGKGQEFDIAVTLGLEEGVIPDFHAESDVEIEEERRVLHVMLYRAKTGLVLTRAKALPTKYGPKACEPSRWLTNLRPHVTSTW